MPTLARANILGVGVSAIDMSQAVRCCEQLLQERRKGYVCVTGVHGIIEAQRDASFRTILNRSFLCTPDGMPTVWVGRGQGYRHMSRVYGPELMLEMCQLSTKRGYRHFLYGGGTGIANQLKRRLQSRFPGIDVVGTLTPPFRALTPTEELNLISVVAEAHPDIIWIGLSTPKQERFMASMIDRLDTLLMVGVGAAFDIHAGVSRDAPLWMKRCGLQWCHRLFKEPRRLWRRYLANNPRFLWDIGLQLTGIKRLNIE
jgi:N-acetylglucosaminyldiphosphoundecaprenol N-acetyl-beta-D-mannosaminyltransferase